MKTWKKILYKAATIGVFGYAAYTLARPHVTEFIHENYTLQGSVEKQLRELPHEYESLSKQFYKDAKRVHKTYVWKEETYPAQTPAQSFFNTFPDTFQYASVKKFGVENPKYCIVHLKQRHLSDNISEEEFTRVRDVQKDLYNVIADIYFEYGKFDLRMEGKDIEKKNDEGDHLPLTFFEFHGQVLDAIVRTADFLHVPEAYYARGAMLLHAMAGKVDLYPAEYKQEYEMAGKVLLKGFSDEFEQEMILERREFATMDCLTRPDDPSQILIYGALHDFKDNIITWNGMYPDKKISLIEVYPVSLNKKRIYPPLR